MILSLLLLSFSRSCTNSIPSSTARVSAWSADCTLTWRANPPKKTPAASLQTPAIAPVDVPSRNPPSTFIFSDFEAGGLHFVAEIAPFLSFHTTQSIWATSSRGGVSGTKQK
ncbi:uncharacterized protein LOC104442959 [Eucalyptus grandis]|uniref:uncharacterized protein LOC104442959 n=1 Tax=Eucalyptus grandis TaxID=71139 RepID=UPI00192E8F78|nr:uncharacterized protein LOC104442959 [Eucalyptus grandis]